MSTYTPGPWTAVGDEIYGSDGTRIAEAVRTSDMSLLLAAPELLEALNLMATIIDNMGDMPDEFIHPSPWETLKCEEALTQARAAIAKAEGEAT